MPLPVRNSKNPTTKTTVGTVAGAVKTAAKKVVKVASAFDVWAAAGFPKRPPELQEQLFVICSACDFFIKKSEGRGECGKCGCGVSRPQEKLILNKLEWATEQCPLNPPKWKTEIQGAK